MGLGGLKSAWQRQTKDFSHTKSSTYSSLIIDNRGIGESDKPLMRYSTSEMAKDVLEVIDRVGWTEQRQLHIVGISMGGMIAQELVCGKSSISTTFGITPLTLSSGLSHTDAHRISEPDLHSPQNRQHSRLHRKPP